MKAAFAAFLASVLVAGCASQPVPRSTGEVFDDGLITVRVKREIFHQDGVRLLDVSVTTYRGVVQLSGFVDTEEERRLAGEAAWRAQGVRDVKNDLRIAPRS